MRSRRVSISIIALAGAIVGAQRPAAAATNFNVTNSGASAYVIDGVNNATLTLVAAMIVRRRWTGRP